MSFELFVWNMTSLILWFNVYTLLSFRLQKCSALDLAVCVDIISRGFWCILHIIKCFLLLCLLFFMLNPMSINCKFLPKWSKQYQSVSIHVRIFFSNMRVIISYGRAKKTVATSWNNKMIKNTFSGMYVLLVKLSSLTTLHPCTYGCKWVKRHQMIPYEPHMYFILHYCKQWTYCFNYTYMENKMVGLKQAVPPVCESWIVLIKNST